LKQEVRDLVERLLAEPAQESGARQE
jgi:hypothetical protein